MKISKARQIMDNDEMLDIGQMAEAALEIEKRKPKPKKPPGSNIGWRKKQILDKEEELRRQAFAKVWNKYKKP